MENKIPESEMIGETVEERGKPLSIVPRFYYGLLAGFILLILAFLYWSIFGYTSHTVTVTGIYHPQPDALGEVIALVPLSVGKPIEKGMDAAVFLVGYDNQKIGHMKATVTDVDESVTTLEEMRTLLTEDTVIEPFLHNGPTVAVEISLLKDPDTVSGYYWTAPAGRSMKIYDMTPAEINITQQKVHPISLWIPQLEETLGL